MSLWLGTCCCSFPHLVRAAAAELVQLHAELVIKKLDEARLPCTYKGLKGYPTMDELLSVVIQRLQENKSWKLWKWPPAAKEFLNATEFRCRQQVCTLFEAMQRDLLGHCVILMAKVAVGGLLLIGLCLPRFCRHSTPQWCAPAALSVTTHCFEMGLIQSFIRLRCRLCIKENFIDEKLRHLLPHNEGSSSEKAAQEAFRLRM